MRQSLILFATIALVACVGLAPRGDNEDSQDTGSAGSTTETTENGTDSAQDDAGDDGGSTETDVKDNEDAGSGDGGTTVEDEVIEPDVDEEVDTPPGDKDDDGVLDDEDNCPEVGNPSQSDCDDDGIGDECDDDADNDGVLNTDDNCFCVPNGDQADNDEDGIGDACDEDDDNDGYSDVVDVFPLDPSEWQDNDGDGVGDNADDDDDNDGLSDDEEMSFGKDCSITDPFAADTDQDGVIDSSDAYPNDPFPAFILVENANGAITVILSDGNGEFGEPFEVGQPLDYLCAAPDIKLCTPTCGAGSFCQMGICVDEDANNCAEPCGAEEVCRQRLYRSFSIGDFKSDGKMDFLAHSYPADPDGTYQLWFFERLEKNGTFPQQYIGQVKRPLSGVVADVNDDFIFDIVIRKGSKQGQGGNKPGYLEDIKGTTFVGNGINGKTACAVGPLEEGCAFTAVLNVWDIKAEVNSQWGSPAAREAQDMTNDGINDLVFGTYPNGGNSETKVYLVPAKGDGTFGAAQYKFSHNKSQKVGPANSMLFADFTGDKVGDVIMGLDDDGDAGSAWLYTGNGDGSFDGKATKAFDINPGCNANCSDKVGRTANAKTFDFNFDGAMDVILGYNYVNVATAPSKLVVFFNKGDGTFEPAKQVGPTFKGKEGNRFQSPQRLCPFYNE